MSFDRVAAIYDATRGLPDGVAEAIADRMVAVTGAGPETRFLEIGVGTGRIALPLIRRGFPYTGLDISRAMMSKLREKVGDAPNLTLIEAEATEIPLEDNSVDVALVVHVLHLVPGWKKALAEIRRVLRPEGYFIECHDSGVPGDPSVEIRQVWRRLAEEAGAELRPDYGTWDNLHDELTAQGAYISQYRVARWTETLRPIDLLEEQRNQTWSLTWSVPREILERVYHQMLSWARDRYGDESAPLSSRVEATLSVFMFPE